MNHHTDLKQLFLQYAQHTDKETCHSYGDLYEQWIRKIPSVDNVLEIGCNLFGGGSLLAFSDRFPASFIVGVDLALSEIIPDVKERENIRLFQGDAYLEETVQRFCQDNPKTFDLIIDDCLHEPDDQYRAFLLWNRLLSPGGLYVIEDVLHLDSLSRKLANHTETWEIMLGDARRDGRHCYHDSVLIGMRRF